MTLDAALSRLRLYDALYQPVEHSTLANRPVTQPCTDRIAIMEPYLGPPGVVLDIGCHTGWFSREFAKRGWRVFGIDKSHEWLEIARSLNGLLDPEVNRPIYDCVDVFAQGNLFGKADVALCLSTVMYWFHPDFQSNVERGWKLMHRISHSSPRLFMDFGGMYAGLLPFTEATVREQFLANTLYTEGQLIGCTSLGRPLFLFTR
jgi:2-polyprenyl-3-methyl-5-hydroxy-6-metoxy-1,4-benzoquinol methylase